MLTITPFETQLRDLLQARSPDIVPYFVHKDPLQRFAQWWNAAMPEVHCDHIEQAYLQPQAAMTAKITGDEIKSLPQFFDVFSRVLVMTGLHYRTRAYHKQNPRLRSSASTPDGDEQTLPLFVALADWHLAVSRETDPADTVAHRHDLQAFFQKARQLQRLRLAVYRQVKAYEFENGTQYGAFRHVAQMAITDAEERIIRFRKFARSTPSRRTTKQVHKLYRQACQAIEALGSTAAMTVSTIYQEEAI
jgi:hypothetical protein